MEDPQTAHGTIIMFDGPDGAGKSTMLAMVAEALSSKGHKTYATRVHGGTPLGEKLREVSLSHTPRQPLTDLYISQAMHAELAHDLATRKAEGFVCLVDRSPAAMWAYQVRAGGLDAELALPIIRSSFKLLAPDLVLVYMAPVPVLRRRIMKRGTKQDYFESKPESYWEQIVTGYSESLELFEAVAVDTSSQSVEAVCATSMRHITHVIEKHETQ